jgi:DNA-binding transcriptional ArsR family regulator
MNTNQQSFEEKIRQLFEVIGKHVRTRIILAIGKGEACVCHLEAVLGLRQAYLSQHLMALRTAGILTTRRDGRYIFYRLQDMRLLELIQMAEVIVRIPKKDLESLSLNATISQCKCPSCAGTI